MVGLRLRRQLTPEEGRMPGMYVVDTSKHPTKFINARPSERINTFDELIGSAKFGVIADILKDIRKNYKVTVDVPFITEQIRSYKHELEENISVL